MAGAAMGRARSTRPGSGKGSPLFCNCQPQAWDGGLSGGTEREAGRAGDQTEDRKGVRHPARYLGMVAAQVAQTRHRRYCATDIFRGMA